MSNFLAPIQRGQLTTAVNASMETMSLNEVVATAIRPVAGNKLQLEIVQKRKLAGRKGSLLATLNKSDQRFGNTETLLFDWITFEIPDFLAAFPSLGITEGQLTNILGQYDPAAPRGTESTVFSVVKPLTKVLDQGVEYTPVVIVTEVKEGDIPTFFNSEGKNYQQKLEAALDDENNVMRTSSEPDGEYIVDSVDGQRIFRFTRTEYLEDQQGGVPQDKLIAGKMTESAYKAAKAGIEEAENASSNAILSHLEA